MEGVNHLVIAVVDSGVSDHKDLCQNILYSLGKDYTNGSKYPIDQNGHGTHVTGILSACLNNKIGISSVLGNATVDILPLKVLDADGLGEDFKISQAVTAAVNLHVDVINMSLAGKGQTNILEEAIREAYNNQIPVVVAAGNWSTSTEMIFPASYPSAITVSGMNSSLKKVDSSDFGWEVDISAPGENIISSYLGDSYKTFDGTSMATPMVSGAVALLKLAYPGISITELRNRLFKSTEDLLSYGYDVQTGAGMIRYDKLTNSKSISPLEWLNKKESQPYSNGEFLISVSPEMVGKKLVIFMNEKKSMRKPFNQ
jgi:subtilisin family serine protease